MQWPTAVENAQERFNREMEASAPALALWRESRALLSALVRTVGDGGSSPAYAAAARRTRRREQGYYDACNAARMAWYRRTNEEA